MKRTAYHFHAQNSKKRHKAVVAKGRKIGQHKTVLFSSKISNSFFSYVERNRLDLEPLISAIEVPEEFLRNPSSWLEAGRMESFLHGFVKLYGDVVEEVGHSSPELRAWGVLDGVLRMMSNPQDLYMQPERILSYFISPQPSIRNLRKEKESISFEAPFSRAEFPMSAQFLLAAFESLPLYMGRPAANIKWIDRYIEISLNESQTNLFGEAGADQHYKPEFLQSLVVSLEKGQRELEEKNRELVEKNNELLVAQKELKSKFKREVHSEKLMNLSEIAAGLAHEVNNPLAYVMSNLLRLNDYVARSQQLVTILVGQDRNTPQVREAMRRMDWDFIKNEYPEVVREASEGLQRVRDIVKDLSFLAGPQSDNKSDKVPADLNQIADRAIKVASQNLPQDAKISKEFNLDKKVPVIPGRIEQALTNLINNAAQAIQAHGEVKIVTSLNGPLALIEVADNGSGMDKETLENIFTPYFTTKSAGRGTGLGLSIVNSIVEMHEGKIRVQSEKGKGSRFTIELPVN